MRANNVLGIIYASTYDQSLPELTNMRTMGSVPFGGRYRLIDFPLSNMVNSGISKVGVITKSNYRSLMITSAQASRGICRVSARVCSFCRRLTPRRTPADCLQTE